MQPNPETQCEKERKEEKKKMKKTKLDPAWKGKKKKKGRPPKLTEPSEKKSQKLRLLLWP